VGKRCCSEHIVAATHEVCSWPIATNFSLGSDVSFWGEAEVDGRQSSLPRSKAHLGHSPESIAKRRGRRNCAPPATSLLAGRRERGGSLATAPQSAGKQCLSRAIASRPFSWEEISAKFDKLTAGHVGAQLSRDIKSAVRSLENIQVSDLTKLLAEVN
jgi:hypothetical protein